MVRNAGEQHAAQGAVVARCRCEGWQQGGGREVHCRGAGQVAGGGRMNAVLKESKATRARIPLPKGHEVRARVAAKPKKRAIAPVPEKAIAALPASSPSKRGKANARVPNGAGGELPSPAPIAVAA